MRLKRFVINTLTTLTALLTASCATDDTVEIWGTGRLVPTVTITGSTAQGTFEEISKVKLPSASDLSLTVTDCQGDYSATWTPWTAYDPEQGLRPSIYKVEAQYGDSTLEGFNAPWFYAEQMVTLSDGETQPVNLECKLSNSLWRFNFSENMSSRFKRMKVYLHTPYNIFMGYPSGETRPIYLSPANVSIVLELTMEDDSKLAFEAAYISQIKGGRLYDVDIDLRKDEKEIDEIVLSFDENITTDDVVWKLSEEFLSATSPEIYSEGFSSGETITLIEGEDVDQPLTARVDGSGLSKLLLSLRSNSSLFAGLDKEINLAAMSQSLMEQLRSCGIYINKEGSDVVVDFTDVARRLQAAGDDIHSTLSLIAVSGMGKVSMPCILNIDIRPVSLALVSVDRSVVGINTCRMVVSSTVNPTGNLEIETLTADNRWQQAEITSISALADGNYAIDFVVPEGLSTVKARVLYCGREKFKTDIKRANPDFTITADAFALKALVVINPLDPSLRRTITSMVRIFAGDTELSVIERDEDAGIVIVAGLDSDTGYSLRASVFSAPAGEADFTKAVTIKTEKLSQIGNASFDDTKQAIKYEGLPSGGLYSQSIVPIYNQQNHIDVHASIPKGWATTNEKTFCMAAKNKNTWFMQPSAYIVNDSYSGGYAMKLMSVAWDTDGEEIPDYLQESQPYVSYSRNVPNIRHRAAGRLFLGTYSFNPETGTEIYTEGLNFGSRPSALSGFYKYIPCTLQPSDRGMAVVEILGEIDGTLEVIGSGRKELSATTGYMAFNVPISYTRQFVKARQLRLMFVSTENYGDIEYESTHIITKNDLPSASSTGSALWIDEISFTY